MSVMQMPTRPPTPRISIEEITDRLRVGKPTVYAMLERGIIPAVRVGRIWIVTREAYMQWERTGGK